MTEKTVLCSNIDVIKFIMKHENGITLKDMAEQVEICGGIPDIAINIADYLRQIIEREKNSGQLTEENSVLRLSLDFYERFKHPLLIRYDPTKTYLVDQIITYAKKQLEMTLPVANIREINTLEDLRLHISDRIDDIVEAMSDYYLTNQKKKDTYCCNGCGISFNTPRQIIREIDGKDYDVDVCPNCETLSYERCK